MKQIIYPAPLFNEKRCWVYQNNDRERLDKFLTSELADFSRSQIQKMIKNGEIVVNGAKATPHQPLKTGDVIFLKKIVKPKIAPLAKEPQIITDTADYLIINKPAGLIVHGAKGIKEKTLTDWLIKKYPVVKKVGDPTRPGLVQRLDREASGLMVIAKTQKMFNHLKEQFQKHLIKKEYWGLAHGNISKNEGVINFPLLRSKTSGKIVAKPAGETGKASITEFAVLKRFTNHTYLNLTLKTGRSHQLRAHMQAYGHPLVGDQLYKNKKNKEKIKLDRIFLHSHLLGFFDLNNHWQEYQSDLPEQLNNILINLK